MNNIVLNDGTVVHEGGIVVGDICCTYSIDPSDPTGERTCFCIAQHHKDGTTDILYIGDDLQKASEAFNFHQSKLI